jgi:hypothetical protein
LEFGVFVRKEIVLRLLGLVARHMDLLVGFDLSLFEKSGGSNGLSQDVGGLKQSKKGNYNILSACLSVILFIFRGLIKNVVYVGL